MTTPEVPDSPLVALLSALGHRDVGAAEALWRRVANCRPPMDAGRRAETPCGSCSTSFSPICVLPPTS